MEEPGPNRPSANVEAPGFGNGVRHASHAVAAMEGESAKTLRVNSAPQTWVPISMDCTLKTPGMSWPHEKEDGREERKKGKKHEQEAITRHAPLATEQRRRSRVG